MAYFSFCSHDSYEAVVKYLQELKLGELEQVLDYEMEAGTHYFVCYSRITNPAFANVMREESGEKKLIYGVNEHGYPLYWKIWW